MVDKMIKYSFILLSEETDGFLNKLQALGVVDVTRSAKPIDDHSASMLDSVAAAKRVIGKLESVNYSKDADKKAIDLAYGRAVLEKDMVAGAQKAIATLAELEAAKVASDKEVKARRPWGKFDKTRLEQLKSLGYAVRYYVTPKKQFAPEWAELYPLQIVSEDNNSVWFVTISENSAEYNFPIDPVQAPEGSWEDAQKVSDKIAADIATAKGQILRYKENIGKMTEDYEQSLIDLDMYLAKAGTESAAENKLCIIEGFAPAENEASLCKAFDAAGVLYLKEDAKEEDNPPIRLKNNKFVKMFESITGMYGMPNYGEYDPTPVVSIFFLLFFAMCMGDAGYGIALILVGLAIKKDWIKIGMFEGLGGLITTLGVATTVVGFFLGTAFGMALNQQPWMPEALSNLMITGDIWMVGLPEKIPAEASMLNISEINSSIWYVSMPHGMDPEAYKDLCNSIKETAEVTSYSAQMVLAILIGVFHLCLAMIIKAVGYTKRLGFKENISTWGWLILILGGVITGALGLVDVMNSDITKIAIIAIGIVSALGIFIFNTPGRNPLVNVGAGLWDTYNMITGIMGDVLSYIRLYALGLAGGMLGAAFNDLGLMVRGSGDEASITGWVFFIIILLIGHVLNLLMSCLGAFVHPLRLNFVEYFKNAGYEGKGKKYNPLKK